MSPSPGVPARSIRCGGISSSAGSARKRSAALESTLHETIRGALRSAPPPAWPCRRSLCSEKTEIMQARRAWRPRPELPSSAWAYLGLAILGWGSFAAFFSHPALIALAIVLFLMTGVALFSRGNLSPGEREDRGNRWVLAAFGVIGLLLAYLPAYTDRTDVWTLDGDAIRWLGVVLFAAGAALLPVVLPRSPVPRARRHPPRPYAGRARVLWGLSSPQLSGLARRLLGMGAGVSVGSRRAAGGADDPAAHRAHPRGRAAAAHPVRSRIRCLPQPHVAAPSRDLSE